MLAKQVLFCWRLYVCLFIRKKTQKLLIQNLFNLRGIYLVVNPQLDWFLVTLDLSCMDTKFNLYLFAYMYLLIILLNESNGSAIIV